MGHFLLKAKDSTGEAHVPLGSTIIRQATIPRANAMMTLGVLKPGEIDPNNDIYDATPHTLDPNLRTEIEREFASKQAAINQANGPDLTNRTYS